MAGKDDNPPVRGQNQWLKVLSTFEGDFEHPATPHVTLLRTENPAPRSAQAGSDQQRENSEPVRGRGREAPVEMARPVERAGERKWIGWVGWQ